MLESWLKCVLGLLEAVVVQTKQESESKAPKIMGTEPKNDTAECYLMAGKSGADHLNPAGHPIAFESQTSSMFVLELDVVKIDAATKQEVEVTNLPPLESQNPPKQSAPFDSLLNLTFGALYEVIAGEQKTGEECNWEAASFVACCCKNEHKPSYICSLNISGNVCITWILWRTVLIR